MAVAFPVAGSFSAFATRFIDPAWGFACGWNYAMQWLFVLPLEIMAASMTLEYWELGIPKAASITIFLTIIIAINLRGVKAYGEAEYVLSILKVTAVIGFMYVLQFSSSKLLLTMLEYSVSSLTSAGVQTTDTLEPGIGSILELLIMVSKDSVIFWWQQLSLSRERNLLVLLPLKHTTPVNLFRKQLNKFSGESPS